MTIKMDGLFDLTQDSESDPLQLLGERRLNEMVFRREISERVYQLELGLLSNTATTNQIAEDTQVLRLIMEEGRGAIKLMCRFAAAWRFLLRWLFIPGGTLWALAYWASHDYAFPRWFMSLRDLFK